MQVTRIRNPAAIDTPVVRDYMQQALDVGLWLSGPISESEGFLKEAIASEDDWGIFLASDGLDFKGLLVIMLPGGPDVPYPQVVHFYSSGKGAKAALIREGLEFLKNGGYTTFWAINATDTPDSIWKRAFKKAGDAKKVGSILEFNLEKE